MNFECEKGDVFVGSNRVWIGYEMGQLMIDTHTDSPKIRILGTSESQVTTTRDDDGLILEIDFVS